MLKSFPVTNGIDRVQT